MGNPTEKREGKHNKKYITYFVKRKGAGALKANTLSCESIRSFIPRALQNLGNNK